MKNETEQNVKEKKPSRRKYIIAAICVALLLIAALTISILKWEPKPDPESEMSLRRAAKENYSIQTEKHKEPKDLTDEDFAILTEFTFPQFSASPGFYFISDIRLLEKCKNLQALQLNMIKYPEKKIPKWMKLLGKLGVFDLKKRFAIDLSPIQKLHTLKSILLSNSQVADISPLKDLKNLEQLFIDNTLVSDLNPLRGLKNLKVLSINGTEVSSLEPIMHLEKLERLLVIECPNITDEQLKEFRAAHPDMVIIKDYVQ